MIETKENTSEQQLLAAYLYFSILFRDNKQTHMSASYQQIKQKEENAFFFFPHRFSVDDLILTWFSS